MSHTPDTSTPTAAPPQALLCSPRKMQLILGILVVCFITAACLIIWLTRHTPKSALPPPASPASTEASVDDSPDPSPFSGFTHTLSALGHALTPHASPHRRDSAPDAVPASPASLPSSPVLPPVSSDSAPVNIHATNTATPVIFAAIDLKEAVLHALPYQRELRVIQRYAGKDPSMLASLDALKPYATTGVSALSSLQKELEPLTASITQQYMRSQQPKNWWGSMVSYGLSYLTIRKIDTDQQDTDPASLMARSLMFANSGNIADALALTRQLPEPYLSDAAGWIAHASAYVATQQALDQLFETLRNG